MRSCWPLCNMEHLTWAGDLGNFISDSDYQFSIMNLYLLTYLMIFAAIIPTCDKQYELLDELENFTAINFLPEDQSVEIDRVVFHAGSNGKPRAFIALRHCGLSSIWAW